jgi:hypothetical protein
MSLYHTPTVLKLINEAFNLEDLNDFCFLYFRSVYDQFTDSDRKQVRVRLLVDYAQRQGQLDQLLTHLKAENPSKYEKYAPQLSQASTDQIFADHIGLVRQVMSSTKSNAPSRRMPPIWILEIRHGSQEE